MSVQINGKWVLVAPGETLTGEVAPPVLTARLRAVERWLPLAAHAADEDVEYVHRLRVCCRRADAAVKAFAIFLGDRRKPTRRWLKRLRQAAGPARDLDVFLLRLQAERGAPSSASDRLRGALARRRDEAQPLLVEVAAEADEGELASTLDKTLRTVEGQAETELGGTPFRQFARQALNEAASQCLATIDVDAASIPQLHKLRIAGKRLRYTLELFHSPLSPRLCAELYPQIESLQERLGLLNDHAAAQKMLQTWLAELPPNGFAAEAAARIVHEFHMTEHFQQEFANWWTEHRRQQLQSELAAATDEDATMVDHSDT